MHLLKTAAKLKSWNHLLSKVASTSKLQNSLHIGPRPVLLSHSVLLSSIVEIQSHGKASIDCQLNNIMHLISGCVWPNQIPWLAVLAKIAPLAH